MSINVEKAMELFSQELKNYTCSKKLNGGVVLHLAPIGEFGYYIGTLTAYDKYGMKSENAVPFSKFIKIINELEDLLEPYQINSFTGRLAGWNPPPAIKSFLYENKVHRLFFLAETNVLQFMKNYTNKTRIENRIEEDIDVLVIFG